MIFVWLRRALDFIFWLVRVPSPKDVARINPNARCPVCGATRGCLRCVERVSMAAGNGQARTITLCEHRCLMCGASYYEEPVVKVGPTVVRPAAPRDEVERADDAREFMTAVKERAQRERAVVEAGVNRVV